MTITPPTSSLSLADVMTAVQLNPAEVLLIRHPMSNLRVREAVESDRLLEYTSSQAQGFPAHHAWWLTFLGEEANSARLVACYRSAGRGPDGLFLLEKSATLADLAWRLIIDWGPGTRSWKQNGTKAQSKPVLAVAERAVDPFPGFENVVLSFAELERVVAEPRR